MLQNLRHIVKLCSDKNIICLIILIFLNSMQKNTNQDEGKILTYHDISIEIFFDLSAPKFRLECGFG